MRPSIEAPRESDRTSMLPKIGAVVWIIGFCQFIVAQVVVGLAWETRFSRSPVEARVDDPDSSTARRRWRRAG